MLTKKTEKNNRLVKYAWPLMNTEPKASFGPEVWLNEVKRKEAVLAGESWLRVRWRGHSVESIRIGQIPDFCAGEE